MKRLLPIIAASLLVSNLSHAAATLPSYDGFNYTIGDPVGQTPPASANGFQWTPIATAGRSPLIGVVSGNLRYPGLATSVGSSIQATGPNREGLRYYAGTNVTLLNNSMYYSVLFTVTDLGTLTTTGKVLFTLNNTSTLNQTTDPSTIPGRTFVRLSTTAGKFNVGFISGYATGTVTWAPQDFSPNDTVFVVFKYVYSSSSLSTSYVLVNPSPNDLASATIDLGTVTTPSYTLTNTTSGASSAVNTIQSFLVLPQANTPCTIVADEVRLGTTFASVTPGGPPGFTNVFPASQSVNYGSTLVLNPGAAGPGALTFQWKTNGVALTEGNGYSGTTTGILSITNANAGHAGNYALTVTSTPYGSADSTTCVVSVADPAITSQPTPQTLPPGANAAFSVGAVGSGTVTYKWQRNAVNLSNGVQGSGSTVVGATTANLAVNNIAPGDSGTYTVLVSGSGPSVLSSEALLTVIDPAITSNPSDVTVNYNVNAAFHVTAAGTGPFAYQWQLNGVALTDGGKYPGFNSANLTVSGPTYLDAGSYQVIVTNKLGNTATSGVAVLTVNDPFFVSQPFPLIKKPGESASFSVNASGSGTLAYQWMKVANGVTNTLTDGSNTNGSLTATLSLSNLSTNDTASYFVVVTGGQTITSASASLVVFDPALIVTPMQPRTVLAGTRVVLVAGVAGTSPLTYTWTKNGGSPLAVPQTNYLNLANVALTDAGTYTLVIRNYAGSATNSTTLSVLSPPVLLLLTNLAVLRVGDGSQTLSVNGNSVYVDQFTPAGDYVNSVTLPDSGSSAFLMAGGGSTFTDCQITRSMDGTLLSLAGYATNLSYGFTLQGASGTTVPRAIYTVDGAGTAALAKSANNAYSGNIFRSAATDGAGNFWGTSGNNGTRYFGNGPNPAANIQVGVTNTRVAGIFNGDLWFTEAQASDQSLWKFSGLPVTAATPTRVLDVGGSGTPSPMAFSVSPNGLTVYIADDRASASGGVLRYDYDTNALTWSQTYVLQTGVNIGARGLTVDWSGANPVIYATTAESTHNRIVSLTDTGVLSSAITLATSGENQLYRSIAFSPIFIPSLAISQTGNQVTLHWVANANWTLQSKTNVTNASWNPAGGTLVVNNGNYSVTLTMDTVTKFFRLRYP